MCLCESSESGWSLQSSWTVYSCSFTCWPSSVTVHYCSYPRLTRPSPAMPRHCPTCRWCWSSFKLVRLWWALLVVIYQSSRMLHAFSALTLLVGWQEGHPACKNWVMLQVCCCRPSGQVILIDCCSGRRMQAVPCCQHMYVAEQTLVSLSVSSGTTQVSRYQKGKTNLEFTEARYSERQWHQLGHMQVCTALQTDNHASTPPLSFLQAGCHSWRPTNSVKALKAHQSVSTESK